ncbi:uncharacterized protein BX664DRAFT_327991 [Halteromyces radiatus]|uniref:uncharacterized protein n=1 Tax=Halteromyces radiatus TaxID=101107 RepID=UPI0022207082|nr:uncharacterized protein BX664DRAFT_327991 [Halteromyces radiatus]KAI8092733.1 hypothetical protein BX664DRAFT_327991 [Halteromyces radiatus]
MEVGNDGNTLLRPTGPLLSNLAIIFVQAIAYTHITRQEALDVIGFMLSSHSRLVHEQLLASFIRLGLLERIPSTAYYRILQTNVCGIFTPISHCYSSTCNHSRPCYSPTCPHQTSDLDLFNATNSWLQRIPQQILQKTHRHELLRQAAVVDLLSMEQSYLADLLVLDEIYAKPLSLSPCIPSATRSSFSVLLFGNYRSIIKLHQRFCTELLQQRQKSNQLLFGNVGYTVQQHIQALIDPYIQYTGNHIRSSYSLRMERRRNPQFAQFLDTQNCQPRTRRLDLGHFLSAPTLWIGKYRMLVEALAKRTAIASEDKSILHQCVIMLQDLLSRMNQAATHAGNDARRDHISASLAHSLSSFSSSPEMSTLTSHQWMFPDDAKLLREGKAWLRRSSGTPIPTTPNMVQCHIFLFDHMLFIAQERMVDDMEEYSLLVKPIPLAAFIWMDDDQHNNYNSSSPLIHRISRHLSSKLSAKSSTIWSTLRKSPSGSFSSSPPIGNLASSKSTPTVALPNTCPSGNSRIRQRLRTNRWSSSSVYTQASSTAYSSFSAQNQLNRRQSVPELSLITREPTMATNGASKTATSNTRGTIKNKRISISPLTPIDDNQQSTPSSSSSYSSTSSACGITGQHDPSQSSSSSSNILISTPSPLENVDNNSPCLRFSHAGWIGSPYRLEFDDNLECQAWRDVIEQRLVTLQSLCSLCPIWEPSGLVLRKMTPTTQQQRQDDWPSFKRLSSSAWSPIPAASMPPSLSTSLPSRIRSDPEEGLNQMQIHCALHYETTLGEDMIALGTQDGVWIGPQHHLEDENDMIDKRQQNRFTQIIPTQACHGLVLIEDMLVAMIYNPKQKYTLATYRLLGETDDNLSQSRKLKDPLTNQNKWSIVKRDSVISICVGRLYQQSVLVYLTRYGSHILAVVAIPKSQSPWFKKVKEYTVCLKDANNIYLHNNTIYVQSNKYGVESIVPSRKRETTVHWQRLFESPCISYLPLSNDHGLVVTSIGVRPVYLPTTTTVPKKLQSFDFELRISSVSMVYPYLIAFGLSMIEIWNVESATLVQVIHSPTIRRLYDSTQCIINNKRQSDHPVILVGPTSSYSPSWDKSNKPIPFRIYKLKLDDTFSFNS